ncbi:MAG: DUF721 domain-containing protein [Desulfamplus sp.]|nr:DUF721 domain-containing protein [Desulfamplus sp.]
MKGKLIHIGDILQNILKNIKPSADKEMMTIWSVWKVAVKEFIAKETKPASFKDGILTVYVSNSVWLQQLKFLKKDMITQLNQALKSELVKDIVFKIRRVDR